MDDNAGPKQERPEQLEHLGGISHHGEALWVDDVLLTPDECPDCLQHARFTCDYCTYFEPNSCRLRRDAFDREEIRSFFDLQRERRLALLKHHRKVIRAIRTELKAHGRPLHYTVLAQMVAERHPKLRVTEKTVLRLMALHPEEFECVDTGVYKCKH